MASGANRSDLVRSRRAGRRLALAALFEADFGQRTAQAVLERHLAETIAARRADRTPSSSSGWRA
jgi:transcription termination factor NusB